MSITVEFKDFGEMREFARELLGTGGPDARKVQEPVKPAGRGKTETRAVQEAPAQAETETGADVPAAQPEEGESGTCSLEDVRAKLAALNRSGKRAQVKELLSSFGVEKLSEIAPGLYTELMEKAEVL